MFNFKIPLNLSCIMDDSRCTGNSPLGYDVYEHIYSYWPAT